MKWYNKIPLWGYMLMALGVIAIAATILLAMGRVPICQCGTIKLWLGDINTSEGSQHISDWYSFSHIIHGIFFYWFFRTISRKKLPIGLCLLFAVGVEAGWELLENSPLIINRYREGTIALNYYGDSVLNSVCDILFCVLGFFLAAYLPVWATISLVIAMELGVGYAIRDNLTLNIIMLIHPFEFIKNWQTGAG
jgi:hypothetical protein